ncbi:MAG: transposase [Candidatus Thiodiazotropha taylori]
MWESRHKASVIDAEQYLLNCYRYIEMNPVRAGMVADPSQYRWSSYRYNSMGEPDEVVSPHERFLALGEKTSRHRHYQALFDTALTAEQINAIRQSAHFSMPLGNQRFQQQVERALGQKFGYAARGRPRK